MRVEEVKAMLKVAYGDEAKLTLTPIFMERYQYYKKASKTKRAGRWLMWRGDLDCPACNVGGKYYWATNHQAAQEMFKIWMRWEKINANY